MIKCNRIYTTVTIMGNEQQYYVIDGEKLVRVSTVLSHCEDKTHLHRWKQRVGVEEANQIKNDAARLGTRVHKALELVKTDKQKLENYLLNMSEEDAKNVRHYLGNYADFSNNFTPLFQEKKLHFKDPITLHEYAGTPDAVGHIEDDLYDDKGNLILEAGALVLIDYKNYKRQKHTKFLTKAFLQLGAYYNALTKMNMADLDGCLLLTCSPRQLNYYYMDVELSKFFAKQFLRCLDYYLTRSNFPWDQLITKLGYQDMAIVDHTYVPKRLYTQKEADKRIQKRLKKQDLDF